MEKRSKSCEGSPRGLWFVMGRDSLYSTMAKHSTDSHAAVNVTPTG